MIAGVYNINIDQGATFERLLTVKDAADALYDFSNHTARMQIRKELEEDTVLASLTTENGYIILGGTSGTINLNLPPVITETLDGDCVYDLEIIDALGRIYRLLKGIVRVDPEVTR